MCIASSHKAATPMLSLSQRVAGSMCSLQHESAVAVVAHACNVKTEATSFSSLSQLISRRLHVGVMGQRACSSVRSPPPAPTVFPSLAANKRPQRGTLPQRSHESAKYQKVARQSRSFMIDFPLGNRCSTASACLVANRSRQQSIRRKRYPAEHNRARGEIAAAVAHWPCLALTDTHLSVVRSRFNCSTKIHFTENQSRVRFTNYASRS